MKIVYVGPHGVVEVPLPNGGWVEAMWGKEADVPDSLGERLLEQPTNWKKVKAAAENGGNADASKAPAKEK